MNNYVNSYKAANQSRRAKKALTIAIILLFIFLLFVFVVGLIINTDGEKTQRINGAIAENTRLKEQIANQNAQIQELTEELEKLRAYAPLEGAAPYETNSEENEEEFFASPRDEINAERNE